MGVIYKLKPEVINYIIEEKKNKPILSCRGLVALVESKFQIRVSKSSINAVIKDAGLSLPVGRRQKKRRRRPEMPVTPTIEMKTEVPLLETEEKKLIEAPIETPVEKVIEEVPVEKMPEKPVEPIETVEKPAEAPIEKPAEVPGEIEVELPLEMPCTGAILLKAVDYLFGGGLQISEVIKNQLQREEKDLLAKTEALIYMSLFEVSEDKELTELSALVNKKITQGTLMQYLNELQQLRQLPLDIYGIISNLFQEVRCVKANLSEGTIFYLDAQLHTVWSTPQIPDDFSTTIYNIKSYINKYFREDQPFILFSAPGYDMPTKEFFDFILGLDAQEKSLAKLILYDQKFEEIEAILLEQGKRYSFIFGLWPWQFGQFRRVRLGGEFRPFYFEPLKKDFYLAEVEIELLQPTINKRVIFKGCALKTNPNEKTRLIILSNSSGQRTIEELAGLYLKHWPNLEETFQDFSRKIEFFTYTVASQRFFSPEVLNLGEETSQDIRLLLDNYLKALDLYVRWHFLPTGYKDSDFPTINERFYSLNARFQREKDHILVTFQPPSGYPFLNDLKYACCRVSEREIFDSDGKRLWLVT